MKIFSILLLLIILIHLSYSYNECEILIHNFFLLPTEKVVKPVNKTLSGLSKYDYILILKTEPKGKDKYILVLNVTFPININIELSDEIIQ